MPNLRPFRDYDEHEVLNLYTLSGSSLPIVKGTVVKIAGSGWSSTNDPVGIVATYGNYNNTLSPRWGVPSYATATSSWTDSGLGMTLYDVRELDENGELLTYNPQKQAEMQCVISGQAVPILTRGIVLYSGVVTGTGTTSLVRGGNPAFSGPNGGVYDSGYVHMGKFLGPLDSNNCVLLKINFN